MVLSSLKESITLTINSTNRTKEENGACFFSSKTFPWKDDTCDMFLFGSKTNNTSPNEEFKSLLIYIEVFGDLYFAAPLYKWWFLTSLTSWHCGLEPLRELGLSLALMMEGPLWIFIHLKGKDFWISFNQKASGLQWRASLQCSIIFHFGFGPRPLKRISSKGVFEET